MIEVPFIRRYSLGRITTIVSGVNWFSLDIINTSVNDKVLQFFNVFVGYSQLNRKTKD